MGRHQNALVVVLLLVLGCGLFGECGGERRKGKGGSTVVGFYGKKCPKAETIVRAVVAKRFAHDKSITPALIRMLFHDSFVKGSDASLLIDSTPSNSAEKDARPNLTIRGFDVIDDIKKALELECPGVVSCADIIPLAVRDAIALAGGPVYEVPTGRRDSLVSLKADAETLPDPAFPITQAKQSFLEKGLNDVDLVTLLGAHTVGSALCGFFSDRMFNYHGTGGADPAMNASLTRNLSTFCPNPFFTESKADPLVPLDQGTPTLFDTSYYHQVLLGNGILAIDSELPDEPSTAPFVRKYTDPNVFFPAFAESIGRLSNLGVLTGSQGEIRRNCRVVNK